MTRERQRVLVVDDDDAIRALVSTILRRRGFQVDTASNGAEGLERIARGGYAVVLLDLMMPVVSGYEVIARIDAMPPPRPLVLVLSAGVAPANINPEIVTGLVAKPFDIDLLAETVSACVMTAAARVRPVAAVPFAIEQTN